jgi:hypothetical protein
MGAGKATLAERVSMAAFNVVKLDVDRARGIADPQTSPERTPTADAIQMRFRELAGHLVPWVELVEVALRAPEKRTMWLSALRRDDARGDLTDALVAHAMQFVAACDGAASIHEPSRWTSSRLSSATICGRALGDLASALRYEAAPDETTTPAIEPLPCPVSNPTSRRLAPFRAAWIAPSPGRDRSRPSGSAFADAAPGAPQHDDLATESPSGSDSVAAQTATISTRVSRSGG